jgi:hypothetical protein
MRTRVAVGRDDVAREIRAATPLARHLAAPLTARAPWATAVLNAVAVRPRPGRPVAVVVERAGAGSPAAVAFLLVRRRGLTTGVSLLTNAAAPVPAGRPDARLLAADDAAADALADGITGVLDGLRGPWSLELTGLPLGDPTARALARRHRGARIGTGRTSRLVDALDLVGPVERSRDPRQLERWLPALLAREPGARARTLLRAAARLHAVTGELELAVLADGGEPRGALLTLGSDTDRWPWWALPGTPGVRLERGAPAAALAVPARSWLPAPDVARHLGGRQG